MTGFSKTWAELQTALRALPLGARVWLLAGAAAAGLAIALMAPVEVQDEAYHNFAPSRLFGIDHFGITGSNAAFLIVGLWGLWLVYGGKFAPRLFEAPGGRRPYAVFFAGAALLAFASGTYHGSPTTDSLLWDRLAMTAVFMALLAIFIADRIGRGAGVAVMLPALLLLGAASMAYWRLTGDLRLYRVVQGLPILLVPLMCLLFEGRLTRFKYVLWMGFWFALATVFDLYDKEMHDLFSVGGHTIKHPAAALACYMVIAMLRDAARRSQQKTTPRGERGS